MKKRRTDEAPGAIKTDDQPDSDIEDTGPEYTELEDDPQDEITDKDDESVSSSSASSLQD